MRKLHLMNPVTHFKFETKRPVFLPAVFFALAASITSVTSAQDVDFSKEVLPVLKANCLKCHGEKKEKGQLRLDSLQGIHNGGESGAALVPGSPGNSLLIQAIQYREELKMPPKKKLSDREISDLAAWVKMGAPWPGAAAGKAPAVKAAGSAYEAILRESENHWAFQPLKREAPSLVKKKDWIRSPIDSFILGALEDSNLAPSAPATSETLIRRVYFDPVSYTHLTLPTILLV